MHKFRHFVYNIRRRRFTLTINDFIYCGTVKVTVFTKWIDLYIFCVNELTEYI
ncbi:hypothetical protein JCM17039_22510 [Blautia glucerasea]